MTTTINGRTPEEIKKGLECCVSIAPKCDVCPYEGECLLPFGSEPESDALAYIQQLESAQPKWISVEERYPADDQCVMYVDDGEIAFRIVRGWALRELCEFPEHREVHRITHWMPLPEPPKEET